MNQLDEVQIIARRGGSDITHHAITHYKWIRKSSDAGIIDTRQAVVNWVDQDPQLHKAFVQDKFGRKAYCGVRQLGNVRFLQTYADGVWTNNLLDLPQC